MYCVRGLLLAPPSALARCRRNAFLSWVHPGTAGSADRTLIDFSVNLVYMRILIFLLHGPAERRPTSVITEQTTDISEITRGYVKQGL